MLGFLSRLIIIHSFIHSFTTHSIESFVPRASGGPKTLRHAFTSVHIPTSHFGISISDTFQRWRHWRCWSACATVERTSHTSTGEHEWEVPCVSLPFPQRYRMLDPASGTLVEHSVPAQCGALATSG